MNETSKENLQRTRADLETALLQDPDTAEVVLKSRQERKEKDERKERADQAAKIVSTIEASVEKLCALDTETKKGIVEVFSSYSDKLEKAVEVIGADAKQERVTLNNAIDRLHGVLEKIHGKEPVKLHSLFKEAIDGIKALSKQKPPVVNVTTPEATVIDKTHVIQETKQAEETVKLIKQLIDAVGKSWKQIEEAELSTSITNKRPGEAIPVTLTDRTGRRFMDLKEVAIQSLPQLIPASSSSSTSGGTGSTTLKIMLDEATDTETYVGEADPGTSLAAALWRIKLLDSSSGLSVTWADGTSEYDKVWNDRATYSYS